jgi:uncharacterized membrane protein YhaH (DUF805 family)
LDLSKSSDKVTTSPVVNPSLQPSAQPSQQPNNVVDSSSNESSFWKSLFSFNGRNRRTRYWLTMICMNLLFLPANVSGDNMSEGVAVFTLLIFIPAVWILLANVVKRCHDLGKSGFFGLLMLIPLVNIIIGIYLAFFQGDLDDNEYGPSPY